MQTKDWAKIPEFPAMGGGDEEVKWVIPEVFFELLSKVLDEVSPLPGEEAFYGQIRAVLQAAAENRNLKNVLKRIALEAERELIKPLFQFRNFGIPCPYNWTTTTNGAAFVLTISPALLLLNLIFLLISRWRQSIFTWILMTQPNV